MKKSFKPACLLFYFLMLVSFFLIGLFYARWTEAGKGQMLAAGAIVLGYGVLFGGLAFIASFFIAYYAKHRHIVISNAIMGVFIIATVLVFRHKYKKREVEQPKEQYERPTSPTKPAEKNGKLLVYAANDKLAAEYNQKMGVGFFQPNFYENQVLYLYGAPNLEKAVSEHSPVDSVLFKQLEPGGFEITQAPPWLAPAHLKLDYDLLYFEIKSLGREFAEVVVNTQTHRTAYVNKYDGKTVFWPEFLLGVHSVEFPSESTQKVKVRPFEASDAVPIPFAFLRPILIQEEWMQVELWNDDFKRVGIGWIRWKMDGELLIKYALLS